MSDPTPIDLSPEALERVKADAANSESIWLRSAFVLGLIERVEKLEMAATKRIAAGHNYTCEIALLPDDPMAMCTCGHDMLQAALTPATPEK